MPRATPCPSCGLPFNQRWIRIASSVLGDDATPSFICPRCTMGRVGLAPVMDLPTAYGVRGLPGEVDISGREDADSGDFRLGPSELAATLRRRVSDAALAVQLARRQAATFCEHSSSQMAAGDSKAAPDVASSQLRMLHVASGEGGLLSFIRRKLDVEVLGLEPWKAWYDAALAADVPTLDLAPELLEPSRTFDVVLEHHLLMRVPDPRAHLRCLAALLDPNGVIVIEVPNLLMAPRPLEDGYLSITRPHLFTPRSLRTLCLKVGLVPIHVADDTELRVFCRRARPGESVPDVPTSPRVRHVVEAIHGNDLRIKLKRGLSRRGPVEPLVEMAQRIIDMSTYDPAKADIAIEVARAFELRQDYQQAARWLRESLAYRADAEVSSLAVRCEIVARTQLAPRRPEPPTFAHAALPAFQVAAAATRN